jgi:1-acyl-sn-glycerol-3-phosphate acyltransferase
MVYQVLKHVVVGPPVRLVFRPWVEGLHHIPATGPAILASNHLSFSDSIFLPLMVPRRITFPAKMEYFTGTGMRGWLTRQFFLRTGQIPIDRSGGSKSMAALEQGLAVLDAGGLFGIYPEGTRSPDGRLYRGKTGVARIALEANVPIVPCAMIDTDKAQPTGKKIPKVIRVGMRIGPPIHHPELAGQKENHVVLREVTDEVMRALQRLSGQEYVDEYAADVKARMGAAEDGRT